MAGTYASIYIQKEGTKYEVYGTYLGDDYIYVADDMDSIKSIIKQDFDDDIVDVKTVNLPFYEMNLIYVKDAKDNEYVIPYEAPYSSQLTPVLETIGKEEGKVLLFADDILVFISDSKNSTRQLLQLINTFKKCPSRK